MSARWLLLGLSACGGGEAPLPARDPGSETAPANAGATDSLVLTAGDAEVWFIRGRDATTADGAHCHERGLEIRTRDGRRGVPLLYTLAVPTVIDDTSIRAVVFHRCAPGDVYRVSLRTGRPTPLPSP